MEAGSTAPVQSLGADGTREDLVLNCALDASLLQACCTFACKPVNGAPHKAEAFAWKGARQPGRL